MTDAEAADLVRRVRSLWDQEAKGAATDVVPDGGSVRVPLTLMDSAGKPTVTTTTPATQTADVRGSALFDGIARSVFDGLFPTTASRLL